MPQRLHLLRLLPGMSTSEPDDDELVLGDENVEPVPEEASEDNRDAPPRVASGGGTLFERMSNLTRSGGKSDDEGDEDGSGKSKDPLDIPRFLNRQNNQ